MSDTTYNRDTGFKYINNLSINSETFSKWGTPPPNSGDIITATKTIDSVHDELGKESNKSKPSNWEDKSIEFTTVATIVPNLRIPEILNTYGKCIVVREDSESDEGKIPYKIPDSNKNCYIKDCFPGSSVPGLNNLLDQSSVSLKTFFEQVKEPILKNPLQGNGGLGQQLFKENISNPELRTKLRYTAYFNYDLLIFRYILAAVGGGTNSPLLDNLLAKINTNNDIIDSNTSNREVLYTDKEILLINTVNLNYLWAYLMIFCKESEIGRAHV